MLTGDKYCKKKIQPSKTEMERGAVRFNQGLPAGATSRQTPDEREWAARLPGGKCWGRDSTCQGPEAGARLAHKAQSKVAKWRRGGRNEVTDQHKALVLHSEQGKSMEGYEQKIYITNFQYWVDIIISY